MTDIFNLRYTFTLHDYDTAISRAEFEERFTKTKETVRFTFFGWDGKSYNGESRNATVYRLNDKGCENIKFIKVGKHIHYIDEEKTAVEKSTGESHPKAYWFTEVLRANK